MCRVMRVSARGYRAWRARPASQRTRCDMKVLAHIREHDSLSLGSYGRPRMTPKVLGSLKEAGLAVGERRVGRLMRINGICPVRTCKHKVTTNSNHSLGIAPNLLDGDFVADMPNRKWAGDISYVWTSEGWLYLAVILDLHSRRVVGQFGGLGSQRPDEAGPGNTGAGYGRQPAPTARRLHLPLGSRQPILRL